MVMMVMTMMMVMVMIIMMGMMMMVMMMMCRKVIKGSDGNVILEITDTTGSHQFPAMRRLSVVRGESAYPQQHQSHVRHAIKWLKMHFKSN